MIDMVHLFRQFGVDLLSRLHRHRLVVDMARLTAADDGDDLLPTVSRDLETILSVVLPESRRSRGADSGLALRQLRCEALARSREASR